MIDPPTNDPPESSPVTTNEPDAGPPADDLEVRPAGLADQPAIAGLYTQGIDEGLVPSNDTGADIDHLASSYLGEDGLSGFWVAELGGRIVGMVGLLRMSDDAAELRRLRVDSRHRRRGIGTRLLEQAVAFCQHHGYLKVVLDVRIDRGPAISLFEKFGFKHARTRAVDGRELMDFYLDLYKEPEMDRDGG